MHPPFRIGTLLGLSVWLTILVAAGCSFVPGSRVRIKIDPAGLPRLTPSGTRSYDAYLINVSGQGISPTLSSASIGSYTPDCVEVGISTKLLTAQQLIDGVSLILPAGVGRKVQVVGVASSFGSSIVGKDVPALFEQGRIPKLYELAVATNQSILFDRRIDLDAFAVEETTNILAKCTPTNPPPVDLDPSMIFGVGIAVTTFNTVSLGANFVQGVFMDKDTGALELKTNYQPGGSFQENLQVTPDGNSLTAWRKSNGAHTEFDIGVDGALSPRILSSFITAFAGSDLLTFTPDSQKAILVGNNFLGFTKFAPNRSLVDNNSLNYVIPANEIFLTGSHLYLAQNGFSSGYNVVSAPLPESGVVNENTAFTSTGVDGVTAGFIGRSVASSKGIYLAFFESPTLIVHFYAFDGPLLTSSGGSAMFNASIASQVRIAVSPNEKFLYIIPAIGTISVYALNEDGGISTPSGPDVTLAGVRDIQVDPTSRFLLAGIYDGGTSELRSLPIGTDGLPGAGQLLGGGALAPELNRLVVYPIR